MAVLAGLDLGLQTLSLTFFLATAAYIWSHQCSWLNVPMHVFTYLSFTALHTVGCGAVR